MFKNRLLKNCIFSLAVFLLPPFPLIASEKEPPLPVLQTKTKTIAVFKNGLAFITRQGTSEFRDGWAVTENVPNASLGSVWIGALDKGVRLDEVIGYHEETKRPIEAISLEELLEANTGKKAKITWNDNKTVEGVIMSVPKARAARPLESVPSADYNRYDSNPQALPKPASIAIIDTGDGKVVLNKSSITKIDFSGDFSTTYQSQEKAKRVKFKVSGAKKDATVALSYLQKGITWIPGYLVNIEDPKKARITLKATLINDVEDLDGVDIFFIVGYPNFIYADVLSPLSLEESLTQFMQSLRREGGRDESNLGALTRQRVSFQYNAPAPRIDYNYETMPELPGAGEEDLFFYSKESAGIKKGERAEYQIFSSDVDYRHVYEWEVPDTINVDLRGNQRDSQNAQDKEQVWHSIKLTNATKYPWTTAPAFVISQWKPLAQDTLNYTSRNSSTNLKMTIATDVKHERQEHETDRQRDLKLYNYSYDLVTVKGDLKIKNLKDKEITMEIKKKTTGEVIEASHKGKIEKIAEGLRGVNQNSIVSWEIPLKAGEEVNVVYRYKVYIAR